MNHTVDRGHGGVDERVGPRAATTPKAPEELFVVRRRIAADLDRVRLENDVRAVGRGRRLAPGRAWLGRRLIAVGTFLADGGTTRAKDPTTARPPH